jgi:hypothetical protein
MNIKDLVSGDKKVHFKYYRKGSLYYSTESGFVFPVPVDDCGDATFLSEDRAMLFMRYIRKELEAQKAEPLESEDGLEVPAGAAEKS